MTNLDSREAAFHDRWAASVPVTETLCNEFFEHPAAPENRFILSQLGEIEGKRLLDIGCGLGESSIYFARRGARVTANDISPGMLDHTVRLGLEHGVAITPLLGDLEDLPLPPRSFDIVYGANILHHARHPGKMLARVAQILTDDGRFFFWDPLAYNPLINVYRWMASAVRTEEERPVRFSLVRQARDLFREVRHREFWLTTLALFLKYFLVDRIHPNTERYWKRIFREDPEALANWFVPLQRLDDLLLCLPPFRFLAWNMVMWGRK